METIWNRIETWLAIHAPEILDSLQPGATTQAINKAEAFLASKLPEDVKASYRLHNGQSESGHGLIDAWEFLSLERMRDEWQIWKDLLDAGEFDGTKSAPVGSIQSDWWNPNRIPLTYSGSGDHHCLDLDPAPGGQVGQIIIMWHDGEHREVIASSFKDWLRQFATDLEGGKYIFSKEACGLVAVDE